MADASHSAAELTVQEYITHHLSFLTFGKIDGSWTFAHTPEEAAEMGFWAINVDTFGWSLLLGAGFLWFFYRVGRTASVENPRAHKILLRLLSSLLIVVYQRHSSIKTN